MKTLDETIKMVETSRIGIINDGYLEDHALNEEDLEDVLFYLRELKRRFDEEILIDVTLFASSSTEVHCHDGVCSIDFDSITKGQEDGEAKV